MSRYNFDITHIKGELNKVVDSLSCYYEEDLHAYIYEPMEYVQADVQINPEGEDLPNTCYQEVTDKIIELCAIHDAAARCSR